jgi:exodeoxyribonuclease-3
VFDRTFVSWNVNSIRARYDRFLNWIQANEPDVICLQELKCQDDSFPFDELSSLGYISTIHGQKTYNGVAILSLDEPKDVMIGLNDGVDDPQARLISAVVEGVRTICVYVPNGGELGSDKWEYKLQWYGRLQAWLNEHVLPTEQVLLCGDFNVAPTDFDVGRPQQWGGGVLCVPEARAALQSVTDWGFVDTFRKFETGPGHYTWWDYRRGGFANGNGLRIDMIYASASLADKCTSVFIDVEERAGEKPSDHAPIGARFAI